jgi:integrase
LCHSIKLKRNITLHEIELERKINAITEYQRRYIRSIFLTMAQVNPTNATILCDYLVAEQNELNIKESTKESTIKRIIWFSAFLNHKTFNEITKDDILTYLNCRIKKPASADPTHKWIGTYNGTQMVFSSFFKWLYNPDEPDNRKRITPPCMRGIKRLPRQEKSPFKPSDLWSTEEHGLFLKYCPSKRDVCYQAMANDTSARPSELLNLRISDVVFKVSESGIQYAEIVVSGKTKSRTLPLISSIPYLKDWLQNHPAGGNTNSWLFVSLSKNNFLAKLSRDALLAQYQYHYKKNFFPKLLENDTVPPRDKALIRNLLTKPFSLYVFRHSALTEKSQLLKESTLRDHAGWSTTSKMPQIYLHYFGNESSNSLLEISGIVKHNEKKMNVLKPKQCPNCSESNKPDSKFCAKCRMVLTYDAYNETLENQREKESEVQRLQEKYEQDMKTMREEMESKFKGQMRLIQESYSEILTLLKDPKKLIAALHAK